MKTKVIIGMSMLLIVTIFNLSFNEKQINHYLSLSHLERQAVATQCETSCSGSIYVNAYDLSMGWCNWGGAFDLCCDYTGLTNDTCDMCQYGECDGDHPG